jgi:hypothetical protein
VKRESEIERERERERDLLIVAKWREAEEADLCSVGRILERNARCGAAALQLNPLAASSHLWVGVVLTLPRRGVVSCVWGNEWEREKWGTHTRARAPAACCETLKTHGRGQ